MDFELQPIKREIIIDGFNSLYYFEFGKNFSHPLEKHDFWELIYVDSGEVIAVTDGIGRTLTQGQVIFHEPMEIHAHVSNKIVSNSMLVISFSSRSEAMNFFDKKIFTLDKTAKTLLSLFMNEAKRALGEIPSEYGDKSPLNFSSAPKESLQLLECYLTELLLVLKRGGGDNSITAKRSESARVLAESSIVDLMLSYLDENVYSNITLSDICKKFFMGKSQVCKIFGTHIGKGPMECYNERKMAEAKRLLREDKSVSTVSDLLGYSSIHNFSRAFKKCFGISPSEYKKKINE